MDALIAGNYPLAAQHYRALAAANPDRLEFSEAARLLQGSTRGVY